MSPFRPGRTTSRASGWPAPRLFLSGWTPPMISVWTSTPSRPRSRPATRMVIICTPNNPTGGVATADEIERLAAVLEPTDALLMSDEIYADLVYEEHQRTIPRPPCQPARADPGHRGIRQGLRHGRVAAWLAGRPPGAHHAGLARAPVHDRLRLRRSCNPARPLPCGKPAAKQKPCARNSRSAVVPALRSSPACPGVIRQPARRRVLLLPHLLTRYRRTCRTAGSTPAR